MRKVTLAVVAILAITLTAVGAVSAMGLYENNSTDTANESPNTMSEECIKWMNKNGDMNMTQCMQMMQENGGSQMAQCMQMMQMCTQMMETMSGNTTDQMNSSSMGNMMNESGSGMGCR